MVQKAGQAGDMRQGQRGCGECLRDQGQGDSPDTAREGASWILAYKGL